MVVYVIFMHILLIVALLNLRLICHFFYLFYAFTVKFLVIVELTDRSAIRDLNGQIQVCFVGDSHLNL